MEHNPEDEALFEDLRRLVVSEPKQARGDFSKILTSGAGRLEAVLEMASRPGEGRIRQMIATVARLNPDTRLDPWLKKWLGVEADEFTKAAIKGAIEQSSPPKRSTTQRRSHPNHFVEAYRYVSDRLCHRVRNSLTLPGAQFIRMQNCIDDIQDPALQSELSEILASLRLSYQRISRSVEFDTGDGYLDWMEFDIVEWIERSAGEFSSRYGSASLSVEVSQGGRKHRVRATKFLLETMFGNLWSNAVQAAAAPCTIRFDCSFVDREKKLRLTVFDNGQGFSKEHQDTAFQQAFSTKSSSRGRGLLEIADAVAQLQGTVGFVEISPNEFRIRIELPSRVT